MKTLEFIPSRSDGIIGATGRIHSIGAMAPLIPLLRSGIN
jgi:hypothetical protein